MMEAEVPLTVLNALRPDKVDEQIIEVAGEYMLSEDHLDLPIAFKQVLLQLIYHENFSKPLKNLYSFLTQYFLGFK